MYRYPMDGAVRVFLTTEKATISGMEKDDLASEVEGWRLIMSLLPPEILEWMARMHETVRFYKRNYIGHIGILVGIKFEPTEYTIGVVETAFSTLTGQKMVEDKTMVIPAGAVMLFEAINDQRQYDPEAENDALAPQSLEAVGGNGNG